MIASRVVTERELRATLERQGFERTEHKTKTGTFWKHTGSGLYVQIPRSEQGFYPDWLLAEVEEQIRKLDLWSTWTRRKPH